MTLDFCGEELGEGCGKPAKIRDHKPAARGGPQVISASIDDSLRLQVTRNDHLAHIRTNRWLQLAQKTIYFYETLIFFLHIFVDEDKFHTIDTELIVLATFEQKSGRNDLSQQLSVMKHS